MNKCLKIVIFIVFNINYIQKGRVVSSADDFAIRKYSKQFYNKLNDSPLGIDSWFLNDKISFYIQDNITFIQEKDVISGNVDSPKGFDELFKVFSEYAGIMQNYSVSSIEYYLQPYDVGESNLCFLDVNVIYKKLRANESFGLKNVY